MRKIVVGISAGRKYENYTNWILQGGDVEIVQLDYQKNDLEAVKKCDGIVLTGGEDVHPRFYDKAGYVEQFRLEDLNEPRDEFEMKVMNHVYRQSVPFLGICRGLQLANVFFGGTLVPDIQWFGRSDHKKIEEGKDRRHPVWLVEDTLLEQVTGVKKGEVNSAHHQSIDRLGDGLSINAVSPDGIVEGAEWKRKEGLAFLLLVQWHPERMTDPGNPLSSNIRNSFVEHIRKSVV